MGRVITIGNGEGSSESVLTETGKGGWLSAGYLRDSPAIEYVEDGETPVFALTNQKRGIETTRDGECERITPGPGYRTVCTVTDRRLLVVVGDSSAASVDGDQLLTVPLVDVESVATDSGRRDGTLTVTRTGDRTLSIHCGSKGLDDVADYVTAASQAWIHVENTLDDVKRTLVDATGERDAGDHETALETARAAGQRLSDPRETASAFADEWGGTALVDRVEQVEERCVETLADVRLGRARTLTDEAEARWRDDEFEAAHDAYERALDEYETVRSYDGDAVDDRDAVEAERERLERVVAKLEESPLRRAIEADRDASNAEDPTSAAERWKETLEHYRTALEIDWGAEERRFAGDPDQIRDRMGEVAERLVSARRSAATKSKRAGDWYAGADQYDVAIEEFEDAREQYEIALEVARDRYPDATDHLTVELDALEERIDRVRAARDGEDPGPADTDADEGSREPTYDVEATIGDAETVADDADDGEDETADQSVEERLRGLDEDEFVDVVVAVLAETGWTPEPRPAPDARYDVEATKQTPVEERMLVSVAHRPTGKDVDQSIIEECASLRRDLPDADSVMVATSGGVTKEGTRHARQRQVRLLDDECLSTVIEARGMTNVLEKRRVQAD